MKERSIINHPTLFDSIDRCDLPNAIVHIYSNLMPLYLDNSTL